jgi:hypothetical protein
VQLRSAHKPEAYVPLGWRRPERVVALRENILLTAAFWVS